MRGHEMWRRFAQFLFIAMVFAIPIEHKYDKPLRHFSLTLIPEGVHLPSGFDKKIYFYPSDIAAVFLFAFALFLFRIPLRRLLFEKGAAYLWVLFASALISIVFSPLASYPIIYTRLLQLLTPLFIFSFLSHCFPSKEKINLLFSVLLASALFQSAIAIAQYFMQSSLGLQILSEPKHITGAFWISDGSRWVFDRLIHRTAYPEVIRSPGTFPHCNVLGGFIALSLLASYSLIATTSKNWLRRLMGIFLIVQFFALSITYSRSAIFGWALGTAIWFSYSLYHRGIKQFLSDRATRFLLMMIAISVATSASLLFNQYIHRGGVVNYNYLSKGSDESRIQAQNTALKIIQNHPIFGVGYQQFNRGIDLYFPPGTEKPPGAHNIYLFIATEMGLISLMAFLCFIATILFASLRAPYSPHLASLLAIFIAFLFIGGCDFYLILFQQGKLMFFCIAGLLAAEGVFRKKQGDLLPSLGPSQDL